MLLSFADWCAFVGTIGTVVAALYAGLTYHRPTERPVGELARFRLRWPPKHAAIPICAAIFACTAFGADYYDRRWRPEPALIDSMSAAMLGRPIGISILPFDSAATSERINHFVIMGRNFGAEEKKIDNAYMISGLTGEQVKLKFNIFGEIYDADKVNPIPPNALFMLTTDKLENTKLLSKEDIMNEWGVMSVIVEYNGQRLRVNYSKNDILALMPAPIEVGPHVSAKNGAAK